MRKLLSLLVASVLAVSVGAQAVAAEKSSLEIGYMPIIPVSQAFVTLENGSLEKAGVTDPELVKFQNGPAIVQALLGGQLDVAYLGIGPAMVARAKGADIKVVASDIVEQISIVALGNLAPYFADGDASTAFARFAKDHGRKPVIATFPTGSVPETVLQYWLQKQIKANPDDLDIIYQGAAQVQQSLMTGAVDGAAILEPVVSIVTHKLPEAKVVARGGELFPHQPGAVLVVREGLIKEHPELVQSLVAAHVAATQLLREHPEEAVDMVGKYVGGGRMPKEIVQKALENSKANFEADPNAIIDGTREMRDFQKAQGTLKVDLDLNTLFDTSFYDKVSQ
ncbi:ABC transporter substrate-binding protein [Pokkaliibacter sp. CJK22405]|uniref:ABC transporter substrate-binding protein n=1 Tax=Pokkaliibacter sp. CJK22405 TaxID=3384615 RepID=UPI00398544B6